MGMYTEIFVNVDLKQNTPEDVIDTLKAMCFFVPISDDEHDTALADKPGRWNYLFSDGSYYTPNTSCRNFTFDDISGSYSLLGKGDIKNYNGEIEEFFEFIAPHVEDIGFIGYSRYEEADVPTLYFVDKNGKLVTKNFVEGFHFDELWN